MFPPFSTALYSLNERIKMIYFILQADKKNSKNVYESINRSKYQKVFCKRELRILTPIY